MTASKHSVNDIQSPTLIVRIANKISGLGVVAGAIYAALFLAAGAWDAYQKLHLASDSTTVQTLQIMVIIAVIAPPFVYVAALAIAARFAGQTQLTYKKFLQLLHAQARPVNQSKAHLPTILCHDPSGYQLRISQLFNGSWHRHDFGGLICDLKDTSMKDKRPADDYRQYSYEYAIIRFTTRLNFPYLLINPILDKDFGEMGVQGKIKGGISLRVEGNFNDRYEITMLAADRIAVLSLLTPDFMSELLDAHTDAAIEFMGHDIYVIQGGIYLPRAQQDSLIQLQKTIDLVLKQLGDIDDSWLKSSSSQEIKAMNARTKQLRIT